MVDICQFFLSNLFHICSIFEVIYEFVLMKTKGIRSFLASDLTKLVHNFTLIYYEMTISYVKARILCITQSI